MSRNYRNKLNRTILLSLAFVLSLAAFAAFHIEPSQASELESGQPSTSAFVDASFNPVIGASSGQIVDSFTQADGKVIITGLFNVLNGTNKNSIARFNADGTLDTTFNIGAGPNDSVFSVDQQADGKLLISGQMTAYDGVPVGRIARLNQDGSLDTTFNTTGIGMNPTAGANNIVGKVKVLSDGKIMIGGVFTN